MASIASQASLALQTVIGGKTPAKSSTSSQKDRTRNRSHVGDDEEMPAWKRDSSYRGQPYRYLQHQNGVMGYLRVRIVGAVELARMDWNLLKPVGGGQPRQPYIVVSVGKASARSSSAADTQGKEYTWKREMLSVELLKGTLHAGEEIFLDVQACSKDGGVQSLVNTAVSTVTGGGGSVLGLGSLELSGLLRGEAELLDVWVELQPKGRVHLLVEYEPKGIAPRPADVVYLESFARWHESLVLPHREPLTIRAVRGAWLLGAFQTVNGHEGRVRIHRNVVFVVERLGWMDSTWTLAARPLDAMMRTDLGSWLVRRLRPFSQSLATLVAPMWASMAIIFATIRLTFKTALAGGSAVARESFRH